MVRPDLTHLVTTDNYVQVHWLPVTFLKVMLIPLGGRVSRLRGGHPYFQKQVRYYLAGQFNELQQFSKNLLNVSKNVFFPARHNFVCFYLKLT